jgi:hypothetical protein
MDHVAQNGAGGGLERIAVKQRDRETCEVAIEDGQSSARLENT